MKMAFGRIIPPTVVLSLALVAVAVSGQNFARKPPSPCVPLMRHDVKSIFAEYPSPNVGYAIDPIEDRRNPAIQLREYLLRDNQFHFLKLDLIVGDHQCFSSLPNMATFSTFSYFYTPCINPTAVPIINGEEIMTEFFLVPPCRSLCEAAMEELARYPGESLEEACPNVRNITTPIDTLLEAYSDTFNCLNYPIEGTQACVPRRGPGKTCVPIPSDHAARRLVPGQFQTGYPTQDDLVTAQTHLRSFEEANRELEGLGLDKLVLDATCQTNLPSTISFLTSAYFPVCTAHPGRNVSLAFPCREYCMKAREELSRYNSRLELSRDCPAVLHMPAFSLHTVLGLPIFECSRYEDNFTKCVQNPNGDAITTGEAPSTPAPLITLPDPPTNCTKSVSVCEVNACQTKFRYIVRGKTFGYGQRKYDYGKPHLTCL